MDGMQFVSAIRDQPDLELIPVIILTARAGDEARVEGLVSKFDLENNMIIDLSHPSQRCQGRMITYRSHSRAASSLHEPTCTCKSASGKCRCSELLSEHRYTMHPICS